jgi:hypothetical protein
MPMIRHQAVCKDRDVVLVHERRFFEHLFEGFVVRGRREHAGPPGGAIQDVENVAAHLIPPSSRHAFGSASAVPLIVSARLDAGATTPDPNVLDR